jgi:hypothetical protein
MKTYGLGRSVTRNGKKFPAVSLRAVINRAAVVDLAVQFRSAGPSASQGEPDPLVEGQFCSRPGSALAMVLQSPL